MATLFKKFVTRPMPAGAKVVTRTVKGELKRFAQWTDRKGKRRTAELTEAGDRIKTEAKTWTAKYRDGEGIVREVATGCRDKDAAMSRLQELTRRAEKVRGNILTAEESRTVDHQQTPLAEHFEAYLAWLGNQRGKGKRKRVSPEHITNKKRELYRLARDCRLRLLRDITRDRLESWVSDCLTSAEVDLAARTLNAHVASMKSFCNWCVDTGRLVVNPIGRMSMLDETSNQKRPRRALTEDELSRLLLVARLRPVAEYGRKTRRKTKDENPTGRRTWIKEPLNVANIRESHQRGLNALDGSPDRRSELERLGKERVMLYKTLCLTGLRKGELASITVGHVSLDSDPPFIQVDVEAEKSGDIATIPLRPDLADELREWLNQKRTSRLKECGDVIAIRDEPLALSEPLFYVPAGLIRILDKDLAAAGIAKVDERGKSVDVHAMRHTFGSMLSAAGVAPRVAQEAMRHSDIQLTMRNYTDPKLLDIAGAVERLPALNADGTTTETAAATGTDDAVRMVAPTVAPDSGKPSKSESVTVNPGKVAGSDADTTKPRKTLGFTGFSEERVTEFEPATNSLGSCHSAN